MVNMSAAMHYRSLFTLNYILLSVCQLLNCQTVPILKLFILFSPYFSFWQPHSYYLKRWSRKGFLQWCGYMGTKKLSGFSLTVSLSDVATHSILCCWTNKDFIFLFIYLLGFISLLLETCLSFSEYRHISEAVDWILPRSPFPELEGVSPRETMQPARISTKYPPGVQFPIAYRN